MDQLKRPLLNEPQSPLTTIVEAEVEKSTASDDCVVVHPRSLPVDVASSDQATSEITAGGSPRKKLRATWAGKEQRKHSRRKPKRATDLSHSKPTSGVNFPTALRTYNIHQKGYGLEPPSRSRQTSEASSTQTSLSEGGTDDNVFSDEGEGVIDSVYSMGVDHDFVDVRLDPTLGEEGMSTTEELTRCKKTVLIFYLNFLKVIGWRRWRGARQDLATPLSTKVLNTVYPSFIFFLMFVACVTQLLTCFYRDEVNYSPDEVTQILIVKCRDHIVVRSVVGDLLLLTAYVLGVYLFRYGEPEHLPALMERVYLSFNFRHRVRPQKRLTFALRFILGMAAVWTLVSLSGNILRMFSLRLLDETTYIDFITTPPTKNMTSLTNSSVMNRSPSEEVLRYVLVIYSIIGFVLFDLLYVAVILSYVAHAQLLLTYINSVIDKVQTKACDLGKAIRDMNQIYDSLKVLNGTISHLTSLCLFIFISTSISSVIELAQIRRDADRLEIGVAVGIVNFTQWTLLALAPVIQASRLTSHCRKLRRLGLEIGARPFSYHDTPQLVLDSFLQYTNATRYTAKLAGVPIHAPYVIGFLFVLAIAAVWLIANLNPFSFAPWF